MAGWCRRVRTPSGFAFAAAQTEWAGVLSLSATQLGSRCSPRASVSSRSAQTSPFRAAPRRSRTAASKHNCLQSVRSLQAQKGGRYRSSGEAALCCRRHPRVAILLDSGGLEVATGSRGAAVLREQLQACSLSSRPGALNATADPLEGARCPELTVRRETRSCPLWRTCVQFACPGSGFRPLVS